MFYRERYRDGYDVLHNDEHNRDHSHNPNDLHAPRGKSLNNWRAPRAWLDEGRYYGRLGDGGSTRPTIRGCSYDRESPNRHSYSQLYRPLEWSVYDRWKRKGRNVLQENRSSSIFCPLSVCNCSSRINTRQQDQQFFPKILWKLYDNECIFIWDL